MIHGREPIYSYTAPPPSRLDRALVTVLKVAGTSAAVVFLGAIMVAIVVAINRLVG